MNRRSFLSVSGLAFAGAATRVRAQSAARQTTVETTLGRIRGYMDDDVRVFKGVRYGASTAGSARFMPPKKPKPWTGIRDATAYGPRSPQPFRRMVPEIGDALVGQGPVSEDCLLLNVWTANPARNGRQPVMLWFHGGGFRTGSGNSVFYDGKSLAQKHGVVVSTYSASSTSRRSAASSSGRRAMSACRISSWHSNGCATTSRRLAATLDL